MDLKDLANNMLPSFVEILLGAPIYMLAKRYRIKEPTAAFLVGLLGAAICVATILISGRPNALKIIIQLSVITAALILWLHVLYGTWKQARSSTSAKGNEETKDDLGPSDGKLAIVSNGLTALTPENSVGHPAVAARNKALAGQNGNDKLVVHSASWEPVSGTGQRSDVTDIVRQQIHKDQNGRMWVDMEVTRLKFGDPIPGHQKELVVSYSGVRKVPERTPSYRLQLEEGAPVQAVNVEPQLDSKWPVERCVRIHPWFPVGGDASFGLHQNGLLEMRVLVEWLAPFPAEAFTLKGTIKVFFPQDTAIFGINEDLTLPEKGRSLSAGDVFKVDLKLRSYQPAKMPPGCIHSNMLHMTSAELEVSCSMLGPWRPDARATHTRKTKLWIPINGI